MTEKRVLILLGSPRKKGNSAALAEAIAQGAQEAGARVETVSLHEMKISPCQSCYACQKPDSEGCAIDDDMQGLYGKLIESEAWVIASPVYWFNMSAQTKLFMDRCFALPAYKKDAFYRKRVAVAMSYGDTDPFTSGCINALRTFQDAFRYVGARMVGMVYGSAMEAGEIRGREDVMARARELGKKL
ncbi:MAG: flavodoxin family protein [Deltaproteobacteria bacterium]|nr:flavodoxin family protein [Deltaproteobacteria bacterium]MBW1950306.1 flavodoxin family protein [Deltaproteobacteria bacterium]MBW2008386.1 flavodoxin family protein [Deltaproteobacteria bacterium]